MTHSIVFFLLREMETTGIYKSLNLNFNLIFELEGIFILYLRSQLHVDDMKEATAVLKVIPLIF